MQFPAIFQFRDSGIVQIDEYGIVISLLFLSISTHESLTIYPATAHPARLHPGWID